jgi:hypothetical protein
MRLCGNGHDVRQANDIILILPDATLTALKLTLS